jgi:3-phosphoshikimate 1-carboxyvinyltransferase
VSYLEKLAIRPLRRVALGTIDVPGSKSITNRALVLAALSTNGCEIWHPLDSEDTQVMVAALENLGFSVAEPDDVILVRRPAHSVAIPASKADLFVANSGTTMRFLTAVVSLGRGRYRLDGVQRMRERPIEDLLSALRELGVAATTEGGNGFPPVVIQATGLRGGRVRIKGDVSSQFLSGLLMAAPLAAANVEIEIDGPLVSQPYVSMTVEMMRRFGAVLAVKPGLVFHVPGRQSYQAPSQFLVEPDASAASYFLAAAALTKGKVCVPGIGRNSLQGDARFVDILQLMGCQVACQPSQFRPGAEDIEVRGAPLRGIDVDMNDISDTVMTLAAVACFAEGPTTIRNVAHIRHKETDRLAALATELRRVGAEVDEFADGLTITPRPLHGAEIETYNDHRMAMSMALIGLRVPGIVIKNPGCVAKTYPGFWDDLEKLRQ